MTQGFRDQTTTDGDYRMKFWRFWGIDGLSEAERDEWFEREGVAHAEVERREAEGPTRVD